MALKLSNDNYNGNEIQNVVIQVLATAPSTPKTGQVYYDSAIGTLRQYDGTAWRNLDVRKAAAGSILIAALAVDPTNRANHTGTQLSASISDLLATIQAQRLDQLAAPNTDISLASHKLINVVDPVNPQDAATRGWTLLQIQSGAAGIAGKSAVVAVATANIASLSGLGTTVDTVALNADGMRVLLTAQTTASQNGPWVVHSGAWTRPTTDNNSELETGAMWFVEQGAVNAATQWWLNSPAASVTITPGTTSVTVVKFNAGQVYTVGVNGGLQLVGGAFSVVAGTNILVGAGGVSVDMTKVAQKPQSFTVGDGTTVNIPVTHTLGTQDVIVSVRDAATNVKVDVDWTATSTTVVTLNPTTAPATNSLRVTIGA